MPPRAFELTYDDALIWLDQIEAVRSYAELLLTAYADGFDYEHLSRMMCALDREMQALRTIESLSYGDRE
ncbi:hypothetical protein [Rhodovibrio sodomensis]|nr:hypothetical protein [Rhodovibrio sodomensis]